MFVFFFILLYIFLFVVDMIVERNCVIRIHIDVLYRKAYK